MAEITVDVRGCDNNTAVKIDVTDEQLELLKTIAREVAKYTDRACAPRLCLYDGDALQYEVANDPEFPDWTEYCDPGTEGAKPSGDIEWGRVKEIKL